MAKKTGPTAAQVADAIQAEAAELPYDVRVLGGPDGLSVSLGRLTEQQARDLVRALYQYGPMILGSRRR